MTITIASHNAYWMQGHPFAGDRPGGAVDGIVSGLAGHYRDIGADLLCLQEIQSPEAFGAVAAAMHAPGEYTPGRELGQYGTCFLSAAARMLADSSSLPFTRAFQIIELDGLRVANVHLPSGRQLGPEAGAARRVAEIRSVVEHESRPVVICGDLNERPHRAVSEYLAGAGFVDAAEITGNGDRCTSIGGVRGDYIWVSGSVAARVESYGVRKPHELLADVDGKSFLSDHLPLWVSLRQR